MGDVNAGQGGKTMAPEASGGAAGITGSPAGGGGATQFLDQSPEAGPCGQYVYDIEGYCANGAGTVCDFSVAPNCAGIEGTSPPARMYSGCGYVFIYRGLNEGDSETMVYESTTHRLVFYSRVGARASGCSVRGVRVGQQPECDSMTNFCASPMK
ncbi:MAG TPA: hypothetical protein VFQ35_26995 [Polyangiaceae bacterium]|nr:hypothetical protein [Polyangiaceae bacterium]